MRLHLLKGEIAKNLWRHIKTTREPRTFLLKHPPVTFHHSHNKRNSTPTHSLNGWSLPACWILVFYLLSGPPFFNHVWSYLIPEGILPFFKQLFLPSMLYSPHVCQPGYLVSCRFQLKHHFLMREDELISGSYTYFLSHYPVLMFLHSMYIKHVLLTYLCDSCVSPDTRM